MLRLRKRGAAEAPRVGMRVWLGATFAVQGRITVGERPLIGFRNVFVPNAVPEVDVPGPAEGGVGGGEPG